MRTKINRGKQGRSYAALCREYETESFASLIADSVMYGHKKQAVEYFNMMRENEQRWFLLGGYDFYGKYGEEARDVIIDSLWGAKE